MVNWRYKCLNKKCNYEFTADTRKEDFMMFKSCPHCKSTRYIKELK